MSRTLAAALFSAALVATSWSSNASAAVASAILELSKSGPATADPGQIFDYTITITNIGADPAINPTVVDALPSSETFQSATAHTGQVSESGGTVNWLFGQLGTGMSETLTISVMVASNFTGTILNTAGAGAEGLGVISASASTVVTATPLPAALPLFATGLGALGLLGWRRKRKAQAVA